MEVDYMYKYECSYRDLDQQNFIIVKIWQN